MQTKNIKPSRKRRKHNNDQWIKVCKRLRFLKDGPRKSIDLLKRRWLSIVTSKNIKFIYTNTFFAKRKCVVDIDWIWQWEKENLTRDTDLCWVRLWLKKNNNNTFMIYTFNSYIDLNLKCVCSVFISDDVLTFNVKMKRPLIA